MKQTKFIAFSSLLLVGASLILFSCSTAPTKFEQSLFDIATNQVPRIVIVTNVVPVYATNPVTVYQTNLTVDKQVQIVPVTNLTTVVTYQTNVAVVTNFTPGYTFTPNTNAAQIAQTGGSIAGLFGPWSTLATTLLAGAFAVWGKLRSTAATNSAKTAGVLAQVIEVGRQVLQTTPQGQALDAQWKQWMIQHQAQTGVIQQVISIVNNVVDNESAKAAAAELQKLIQPKP